MSSPTPLDDIDTPAPSVELAAWQARVLKELTEIGMSIARGMERRVLADRAAEIAAVERNQPLPARDGFDPGLAYARISKAVRLNLTLMTRLADEQVERDRGHAEALAKRRKAEAERRAFEAERPWRERREAVFDAVDERIEARGREREAVWKDLNERLDDEEDLDDFLTRPLGEMVALICKDLGVAFDPADWVEDEHGAKSPLHPASQGPPPPTGEELGLTLIPSHFSPVGGGGPRSGRGGSPRPSP
ncbi:MAG: hypothetical protein P4L64_14945 [Caulobacteraceae bacterium]|nr:hypothetical protein [Caulobacteraceae bacterium]